MTYGFGQQRSHGEAAASGFQRSFRLDELDEPAVEEYRSNTSSTDKVLFATVSRDGMPKRYFGCSPDMLFEIDEETYGTILPFYRKGGGL